MIKNPTVFVTEFQQSTFKNPTVFVIEFQQSTFSLKVIQKNIFLNLSSINVLNTDSFYMIVLKFVINNQLSQKCTCRAVIPYRFSPAGANF